jgi:prepilin-type N-terminal cleavage/methylation domain-containing protein|tara:strand:+ start:2189 stop:2701 length:513 start_codon:yes stop_codon:yes gene_type:complete
MKKGSYRFHSYLKLYSLQAGYTLIELISVIAILGILASFVVVDQVTYYRDLAYAADVEKFIEDMEYARDHAIARKKRCVISITEETVLKPAAYQFNLETADGPQVILPHNSGNHSIAMPEGASIPEADITITLDTRGRPSNNVSLTYESNKYSPGVTITFNSITGFITIE